MDFFLSTQDTLIASCISILILIQFYYYVVVFRLPFQGRQNMPNRSTFPVSVLICAKNEAQNIQLLLDALVAQNYPHFEMVLIDDASSDNTLELFENFANQHSNAKVVAVKNNEAFWGSKKYALTLGIKAASHEHLLFTDADCWPNTPNWIAEMTAHFDERTQLILGYGGYQKISKSWLNKLIRFETLLTAIHYFSWAKKGKSYMGVGRNMAYTKTLFFENNGFVNHMKINSGDDDLFVNEVAKKQNTKVSLRAESFTYSTPKTSYKAWFHQKRRHIGTAKFYKTSHKIILSLFFSSQFLFFISTIAFSFWTNQIGLIVALVLLRYLFTWIIIYKNSVLFQEKDLAIWYPLLEINLIGLQLYWFIINIFKKNKSWK